VDQSDVIRLQLADGFGLSLGCADWRSPVANELSVSRSAENAFPRHLPESVSRKGSREENRSAEALADGQDPIEV